MKLLESEQDLRQVLVDDHAREAKQIQVAMRLVSDFTSNRSEKGKEWRELVEDNPDTPIHVYKAQKGVSFATS